MWDQTEISCVSTNAIASPTSAMIAAETAMVTVISNLLFVACSCLHRSLNVDGRLGGSTTDVMCSLSAMDLNALPFVSMLGTLFWGWGRSPGSYITQSYIGFHRE